MRTFTGWREVGRAMRWARQQGGVTVDPIKYRWHDDFSRSLEIKIYNVHSVVVEVNPEDSTWSAVGAIDAATILRVLAALDLIPAELAEVGSWLDQAVECFGEPHIALPEPVIRFDLNRRCWVWFVDGQNFNVAIDQLRPDRFKVTANSPGRLAEIYTKAEPTDAELRSALDHAWPGYSAVIR
jgi:hypothetical protein